MARSTRPSRVSRAAVLLIAAASILPMRAAAQLAPIQADSSLLHASRTLQLDVRINGVPTSYVAPFVLTPPNQIAAARGDLEDVGVKIPGGGSAKDLLRLDQIPGVVFHFDERSQTIDFTLSDAQRLPRTYDARGRQEPLPPLRADWGAAINYTLFATSAYTSTIFPKFSGLNASLDARAFGPYGTFTQTAIAGNTIATTKSYLRLDTAYTYPSPDLMLTGRVGDSISGGLVWTRPIRFGGLQVQRDFTLRSDLVTQPIPVVSGSAAVPSTVDVYLGNIKAFSQTVAPGPYQITNLPVLTGSGTAKVVVSDATGRQQETTLPFFNSPTLLAKGLSDFSLDAGFARRYYGATSFDYDNRPLGSASGRYGLVDWMTLEGHAEGGAGGVNGGAGSVTRFGAFGTISGALSASRFGNDSGMQVYFDYNVQAFGVSIDLSTQRAFGRYGDLAMATTTKTSFADFASAGASIAAANYVPGLLTVDPRPPRSLDRISISTPLPFDVTSLSLSYIDLEDAQRTRSRVVTASLSRPLPFNATAAVTVFADLSKHGGAGLFAGISFPLGADVYVSSSVSAAANNGGSRDISGGLEAQKTLERDVGSYGWHVQDVEGSTPYRTASAAYRSAYGTAAVGLQQLSGNYGGSVQIDGSIAAVGGGVFAGNRVDDSFAVVDAGIPGVPVLQDNRPIGTTDMFGKLMVADLRSYQRNKIAIDPTRLPAGADADVTNTILVPTGRSGAYLDFGVRKDTRAAIVVLAGPDGKMLPPGSKGHLEGSDKSFVVGYDGQAYLRHLAASNVIIAENGETECRASFPYAPTPGKRTKIGPVVCQ